MMEILVVLLSIASVGLSSLSPSPCLSSLPNSSCPSSTNSSLPIIGISILRPYGAQEGGWGYSKEERYKIVLPADQPFHLLVFGSDLENVEEIFLASNCCHSMPSSLISRSNFINHWSHFMRISLSLKEEIDQRVCILFKGGTTIEVADWVISTASQPQIYKLRWLWLEIVIVLVLHLLSALFSGLSLGLMTLTVRELELVKAAGTETEQQHATVILPIRRRGNQLLCTLLLGNTIVNTTISVLMSDLIPDGVASIIVATLTILVLGEILPQSFCVNKALAVGARTIAVTQLCIFLMWPVAWPIGKLLDRLLGGEREAYDKKRLLELMKQALSKTSGMEEQLKIAVGAMKLTDKCVKDCMKSLESVFMLPDTATLDAKLITKIVNQGYTRIPVFRCGDRNNVTDVLIVKDLALLDPDDNFTVATICGIYKHRVMKMPAATSLLQALARFRHGEDGHLAMISDESDPSSHFPRLLGIVTLEDIVEQILQFQIRDEFDNSRGNRTAQPILFDQDKPMDTQISLQIQMVTLQYLVANEEAFREKLMDSQVLERLIATCTKKVFMDGFPELAVGGGPRVAQLYMKGEISEKYILILEGRASITIGASGMKFEAGPFTSFGREMLHELVKKSAELEKRLGTETIAVVSRDFCFTPDFSLIVLEDCTFLEISAISYIKALQTTRFRRQRGPPMPLTQSSQSSLRTAVHLSSTPSSTSSSENQRPSTSGK